MKQNVLEWPRNAEKKGIKNNPLLHNLSIRRRQVVLMLWPMIIFDFYGGLQFHQNSNSPFSFLHKLGFCIKAFVTAGSAEINWPRSLCFFLFKKMTKCNSVPQHLASKNITFSVSSQNFKSLCALVFFL